MPRGPLAEKPPILSRQGHPARFSPPSRGVLNVAFIAAAIFTAVDAAASYLSIALLGVAQEVNPWLNALADAVGFGGAMIVRSLLGLGVLVLLWWIARSSTKAATVAGRGVIAVAVVFGAISAYHLVGLIDSMLPTGAHGLLY